MEERKESTSLNCPRRLDFSLPLLSTRRLGGFPRSSSGIILQDTTNGIPFCWEQAPGKPKNSEHNENHEADTPRPRLPPCRWRPEKKASRSNVNIHDRDDNKDEEDDDDLFSDAVDVLSLTEAIDIVQKAEDDHGLDRLNLESVNSGDTQSTNFMIERFLPDATALAASSALYASRNLNKKLPYFCNNYTEEYVSQTVTRSSCPSESAQKGCGLEILFPWRMKHSICGVKSPVRQVSSNAHSFCTTKQKKQSSSRIPSGNSSKKDLSLTSNTNHRWRRRCSDPSLYMYSYQQQQQHHIIDVKNQLLIASKPSSGFIQDFSQLINLCSSFNNMDPQNKSSHSSLCVKGCGFYGTAQNHNMCFKCYNDYLKQEIIAKTASITLNEKISTHDQFSVEIIDRKDGNGARTSTEGSSSSSVKNRCESCNKKVGLTGFSCRCGKLFCGIHRYPKEHSCTFDYKMFDRQVLVKQNLLIQADKLEDRL